MIKVRVGYKDMAYALAGLKRAKDCRQMGVIARTRPRAGIDDGHSFVAHQICAGPV